MLAQRQLIIYNYFFRKTTTKNYTKTNKNYKSNTLLVLVEMVQKCYLKLP